MALINFTLEYDMLTVLGRLIGCESCCSLTVNDLLQIPPKMPVILTQYLGSDNVLHGKDRRRSLLVRSSLQRMSTAESH